MSLTYYLLYTRSIADRAPASVVLLEPTTSDALLWNLREKAWVYDPPSAQQILFDQANWDRFREVDRAEAEAVTPGITGGEPLPDEETIRWLFQWKGEPPGLDPM